MFFEHEPLPAESFQQRNPTDQRNAGSAPASPTNRQRDTADPNVPFQVIQYGPKGQSDDRTAVPQASASISTFGNPSNTERAENGFCLSAAKS